MVQSGNWNIHIFEVVLLLFEINISMTLKWLMILKRCFCHPRLYHWYMEYIILTRAMNELGNGKLIIKH